MRRLESSWMENVPLPQGEADRVYGKFPDMERDYMTQCPSCGKSRGEFRDGIVLVDQHHLVRDSIGGDMSAAEFVEQDGEHYERCVCNCHDQLQRHKWYSACGIGSTYQYLWWHDYHGDPGAERFVREKWVDRMDERLDSGVGMLLTSERSGTGKTMLATIALREAMLWGATCFCETAYEMVTTMKAGWRNPELNEWYQRKLDSAKVLMIDDLGKEGVGKQNRVTSNADNDWSRRFFDNVLRTRTQQGLCTIITTNFTLGDIERWYGSAVASLVEECVTGYQFDPEAEDYRPQRTARVVGKRRIW